MGGIIDGTSLKTGGFWSYVERQNHIIVLELKAAFLSLKILLSNENYIHIKLLMDNSVAVSYLSKFGGRKEHLNELTKQTWFWCISRDINFY